MPRLNTDPGADLLSQQLVADKNARVLLHSAESPAFLRSLTRLYAHIDVYDLSSVALALAAQLEQANLHLHDRVYSDLSDHYDLAIVRVSKGRELLRGQLYDAYRALRPGGRLLLAGANKAGAKSAISDAETIFGKVRTLAYKGGHRVAESTRQEETARPFPLEWDLNPAGARRLTYETPYGSLELETMPGVFSWSSLDAGTAFLLESLDLPALCTKKTVLDMGCGLGMIGLLAARYADQVTLVDENLLALRCARANITRHNLHNAEVLASDVYAALTQRRYDLILCNPPFHRQFEQTTDVAARIISEAPAHLSAGGRLIIVANAFLPYRALMQQHFRQVNELAHNGSFMVLEGLR